MQPNSTVPSKPRAVDTVDSCSSPQSWPLKGEEQAIPLMALLEQARRHSAPLLDASEEHPRLSVGIGEHQMGRMQTILAEAMDILSDFEDDDDDRDLRM